MGQGSQLPTKPNPAVEGNDIAGETILRLKLFKQIWLI